MGSNKDYGNNRVWGNQVIFTTIWDGIKLQKNMEQVNLSGNNRIVFCGDYIDYGDSSYYVLKYLWDLQKIWCRKSCGS